jgi:phenylacetyl-CoA:acceptor oxidoreductase subunit 1
MVVDINRCIGCQTCTIACKDINDTPPGVQWRRVLDVEQGTFPDVERLFLVVGCQHCEEPPCVPVCPSGATAQRADGLVTMDYDTCIGCGYCAVSCPYQARTIVHDKKWFYGQETEPERIVSHDDRLGVANKCTFCKERLDDGLAQGLTPGVDPEATPMCSASCIARAIHFGDFNDPDSNVSLLTRDNQSFQMHEELGTNPQIRYLYETPAVPGREATAEDTGDERLADPANPLVGQRQTFWDLRAAVNFTMGGFSSGLAALACLLYFAGIVHERWLLGLYLVAGVCMAVGLFFVFLEIGRKLRFFNVLRRPQSSWMTRETYVVAVFYPALLADLIWPSAALHLLIGLAAAAFLFCQARILYAAKGIPAWRHPLIPWMLAATGLAEGAAFITLSGHLAAPTAPWLSPVTTVALPRHRQGQRHSAAGAGGSRARGAVGAGRGACAPRRALRRSARLVRRPGLGHRDRRSGRARRRGALEVHGGRLRLLPAGLRLAENAPARLRRTRRPGALRRRLGTPSTLRLWPKRLQRPKVSRLLTIFGR